LNPIRVLFFGNYHFSVSYLDILYKNNDVQIVGVITCKTPSEVINPVRDYIRKKSINLYEVKDFKNNEFFKKVKEIEFDFIVSAAFPRKIPQIILNLPKLLSLNIHPSMLPKLRGPDPIRRGILQGDKEFGISFHKMEEIFDTGDILWQESLEISGIEDTGEILNKLIYLSRNQLVDVMNDYACSNLKLCSQNGASTYARSISFEERKISENSSYELVLKRLRACFPYKSLHLNFESGNELEIFKQNVHCNSEYIKIELPDKKKIYYYKIVDV